LFKVEILGEDVPGRVVDGLLRGGDALRDRRS
jgi:hypothetical protein